MLAHVRLFLLLMFAGGAGGLVGSIIGAGAGRQFIFVGGVIGGLITTSCSALIAGRLRWIDRGAVSATAAGGAIGFLAAVAIAVNTLHSPVGPISSTLLIGTGGLFGQYLWKRKMRSRPFPSLR